MAPSVGEGVVDTPHPPIFVLDTRGSDGTVFSDVAEAARWVEAIDLERGSEEVFDSQGRRLGFTDSGHNLVLRDDLRHTDTDAFERRVRALLDAIGEPLGQASSLDDFVAQAAARIAKWQRRR
jgi:hypothetical protein